MRELEILLSMFHGMTPFHAALLAALEALIPPLPLAAIVGMNVASFGVLRGFLYSWIGSLTGSACVFHFFFVLSGNAWVKKKLGGRRLSRAKSMVEHMRPLPLLFLMMLPFTPSAFMNFAFGICAYPRRRYLSILIFAKAVMIGSLALLGKSIWETARNPVFILASLLLLALLYAASRWAVKRYGEDSWRKKKPPEKF